MFRAQMPYSIACPRCHRTGLVRLETVIKGTTAERQYHCGGCAYGWSEDESTADADRRKRVTKRRAVSRSERRQS